MKRMLSTLLCILLVIGLLPTMAFAADRTGIGTEADPYVYAVSTAEDLTEAVGAINADTSDTSYYTISLQDSFSFTGMTLNYNTTTLLGNGNTLTLTGGMDHHVTVVGKDEKSKPVLILGSSDGTDTLTLKGQTMNDCPPFFVVGNVSDGKNCGTLKMYDGVTITGSTGSNYYGGAVIVGSGGYFEMNGGTIEKCGIDGGTVCFGGAVAVINGGVFTMNSGSIQNCFLKTAADYTNASYFQYEFGFDYQAANNLLVNSGAGAGVFVSNGAVFKMNGGEIKNNTISTRDESVKSYGVGGGIAVLANMDSLDITARVEITGGTIEGNKATLGGGGIAVCGMMPFANAISNSYTPGSGSGTTTPGVVISGTEENPVQIKNNSANGWIDYSVGGGGILLANLNDAAKVQISNAEITGNSVDNGAPGGGIESWSNISTRLYTSALTTNDLAVTDTVIKDNSATAGGGICLYNGTRRGLMKANFSNTVVTGNSATDLGGGFSVEAESTTLTNTDVMFTGGCAVYGNTADVGADDFYKNDKSTVEKLPTAEQMSATVQDAVITGWYHDKEDSRYSKDNAEEYTPENSATGELQLKAVTAVIHTVRFDTQGGSDVAEQTVIDGKSAAKPDDPTKSGYTFVGWYTDNTCETAYSFDSPVTKDITLYAKWKKISSGGGGSTTYYYFALEKIDAQDSHTLNGAKFGLYLDGKQIATATSNSSGIATFRVDTSDYRKITTTSSLYYQELTAPEGYVLSSDKIDIEKSDLTTSQTTAEKKAETVRNYQKKAPDGLNGDDHVAYVHGYTDGTVKPNNNITRAETATMLYRLLTENRRNELQTTNNSFSDVLADDWYSESVSTMANGKYITGYPNGTFGGSKNITRAEFVTMLVRFIGVQNENCSFTDISKDYWAYSCIATATKAGWIAGYNDGTFRPEQPITRAEAMTIINRVLNRGVDEKSELLNFKVWPDNKSSAWYYYDVIEASNEHEYTGSRPSENWTSLRIH